MTILRVTEDQINDGVEFSDELSKLKTPQEISNGIDNAGGLQLTTLSLINEPYNYEEGVVITTTGFSVAGDAGGAQWEATSTTGLQPSQTPADRGAAELVDGSGMLWVLVGLENPNGYAVGLPTGGDDTELFNALIKSAKSQINTLNSPNIAKPDICQITIEAGDYTLTDYVKTENRYVVYNVSPNAKITGSEYLVGRIEKGSFHTNVTPTGIRENSQSKSFRAMSSGFSNGGLDADGGTFGISDIDSLSIQGTGDSVALTTQNILGLNLRKITGTTFGSNTVTFTSAVNCSSESIPIGSLLYCATSKSIGLIESIIDNTITVQKQWYVQTGVAGSEGAPIDGETVYIDYYDKLWGQNTNVIIPTTELPVSAAGYEMGIISLQDNSTDTRGAFPPYVWGFDAVNLENSKPLSIGFVTRNNWLVGFSSNGPKVGFKTQSSGGGKDSGNEIGFFHEAQGATAFRAVPYGGSKTGVEIRSDGSSEWGDYSGNFVHDYRTLNSDFDVRFNFIGGNATTSGQGTLQMLTALLDVNGAVGATSYRVDGIPGVTGTFTTADNKTVTVTDGLITGITPN